MSKISEQWQDYRKANPERAVLISTVAIAVVIVLVIGSIVW